MTELVTIGTFDVPSTQRERFISGALWQEWYSQYPMLFDENDLHIVENQARGGYHFYEWLAAILIYHSTGYLSLVEKYQYDYHKHKQQVAKQLNSPELLRALAYRGDYGAVQCPDLLVYAPDFSDWYFCEVKGGSDRIRPIQQHHFRVLSDLTGKPIRLVKLKLNEDIQCGLFGFCMNKRTRPSFGVGELRPSPICLRSR
jgi:hypothetical protein